MYFKIGRTDDALSDPTEQRTWPKIMKGLDSMKIIIAGTTEIAKLSWKQLQIVLRAGRPQSQFNPH